MQIFTVLKSTLFASASVIAFATPAAAQEQADTTGQSTVLEEVVIEGRTRRVTKEGFEIIPSAKDKKFSDDAYTLVELLGIPGTDVNSFDKSIKSVSGSGVEIFIDYIPCTQDEAMALNTKNVLRVDYLNNPIDPRFKGAKNVINFIMRHYECGGFTKLSAGQDVLSAQGTYSLASKFEYKKTTLDLFGGYSYFNDSRVRTEQNEEFRNIDFNGAPYESIRHITDNSGREKGRSSWAKFSATTKVKDLGYVQHSARLNWNDNPGSRMSGSDIYSPQITGDNFSSSFSKSRSLNLSLFGDYSFNKDNSYYTAYWTAKYALNKQNSQFSQGDFADIFNSSRERIWSGSLLLYYYHRWNNCMFDARANGMITDYRTNYHGSFNRLQKLMQTG